METGQKIYQLRKAHGMTLEELGNRIGVGKSTIKKWEDGKISNMRRDKIAKLSEVFQVSPTYFLNMDDPEDNSGEYYFTEETKHAAQSIFENQELRLLFDAAKDAKPEDIQTITTMLLALKAKERE